VLFPCVEMSVVAFLLIFTNTPHDLFWRLHRKHLMPTVSALFVAECRSMPLICLVRPQISTSTGCAADPTACSDFHLERLQSHLCQRPSCFIHFAALPFHAMTEALSPVAFLPASKSRLHRRRSLNRLSRASGYCGQFAPKR
jgi:hypothetical protein